jgi:hypothetical protein
MSDYGDVDDAALVAFMEGFEIPKKSTTVKEIVLNGEGRKYRRPRGVGKPREHRQGEWNEDLSDTENVLKLRANRLKNRRRREKVASRECFRCGGAWPHSLLEPCGSKVDEKVGNESERKPGEKRKRVEVCDVDSEDDDTLSNKGGPPGFSRAEKRARRYNMVRDGGDDIPDWIEVLYKDWHKYAKITSIGDKSMSLKKYTLLEYREELGTDTEVGDGSTALCRCGGSRQHMKDECVYGEDTSGDEEVVEMGKLFSFVK